MTITPRLAWLGLASALLLVPRANAHPIHRSTADAVYAPETKELKVTLRVFADDFEAALSAHAQRKILLESPPSELDAALRAYLIEHFIVKTASGRLADQRLRGHTLKKESNEFVIDFEVALPGGVEGAKIHHTMLSEHFGDQLNSVTVRDGERQATLVFLPNHREKTVRLAR